MTSIYFWITEYNCLNFLALCNTLTNVCSHSGLESFSESFLNIQSGLIHRLESETFNQQSTMVNKFPVITLWKLFILTKVVNQNDQRYQPKRPKISTKTTVDINQNYRRYQPNRLNICQRYQPKRPKISTLHW